jgi:hypothetical protein
LIRVRERQADVRSGEPSAELAPHAGGPVAHPGQAITPRLRARITDAEAGLVTCGLCGCAMTAEIKKGRYIYYHCTGFRGRCGNTYIREESLSKLFEDVVRRVQIPEGVAEDMAQALRDRQDDKERFHRTGRDAPATAVSRSPTEARSGLRRPASR